MKSNIFLAFAFVAVLLTVSVSSCKKDEVIAEEEATITVTSPNGGSLFANGDTVFIKGSLSAPETIHGYEIVIHGEDLVNVFATHVHAHGTEIDIDTFWVNTLTVTDTTDMEVGVFATLDHDGNVLGKTVEIQCIP